MSIDIDTSRINLVKQNPALYNRQDFNYKNKEERKKLWNSIACTLPITSDEAGQRWIKLKKLYVTEKKKYESGNGLDPPAIIKTMDFLDPHIVQRKPAATIPQVNDARTREPVAGSSKDIIEDSVKVELGGLDERPASEAESEASLNDITNPITSRASELRRKRKYSANNEREDRKNQGAVAFGIVVAGILSDMSNEERKLKMKKIMDDLYEKD